MVSSSLGYFQKLVNPSPLCPSPLCPLPLCDLFRKCPEAMRQISAMSARFCRVAQERPRQSAPGTWWVVLVYEPDTDETCPVYAHWCVSAEHAVEQAEAYGRKGKMTITCTTRAKMEVV